jgi:hypothetical protein
MKPFDGEMVRQMSAAADGGHGLRRHYATLSAASRH